MPVAGTRGRRRKEVGAVAVEFALLSPILIALLLGVITTGLSYSNALGVTNAVREGARFGAIADATSASWPDDVIARVRKTQFDDPGLKTSICVEFWKSGSPTPAVQKCDTASGPGVSAPDIARYPVPPLPAGACVVRVVATRTFTITAVPLLPSINSTMARGSVARYESKGC